MVINELSEEKHLPKLRAQAPAKHVLTSSTPGRIQIVLVPLFNSSPNQLFLETGDCEPCGQQQGTGYCRRQVRLHESLSIIRS